MVYEPLPGFKRVKKMVVEIPTIMPTIVASITHLITLMKRMVCSVKRILILFSS